MRLQNISIQEQSLCHFRGFVIFSTNIVKGIRMTYTIVHVIMCVEVLDI